MKKLALIAILSLVVGSTFTCPSQADIVANFTDGNGTGSVDQYTGTTGSGWNTVWTPGTTNATQTPTVVNTTPLNGGGNYLNVGATGSAATAVATVRRQYADFGDVDVDATPYILSFDYRANTALGDPSATNSASNRYNIIGSTSATTGTLSGNTWIAGVYAGTNGGTTEKPIGFGATNVGRWVFLDNQTAADSTTPAMNAMNFWDSEISLATGTVYHFSIYIDPANREYKPTISDGTTTKTSPTLLGFRNETATSSTFLQFHAFMTTASASLGYSVDNIRISIVPEPAAVLFGCVVCGLVGIKLGGRRLIAMRFVRR
ncbi:MAG: hypothetical protein WD468_01405 [Pirellulales bacterium]